MSRNTKPSRRSPASLTSEDLLAAFCTAIKAEPLPSLAEANARGYFTIAQIARRVRVCRTTVERCIAATPGIKKLVLSGTGKARAYALPKGGR